MPKFVIEREIPGAGKLSKADLQAISQKSCGVLSSMGPKIQWLESYVTDDKIYCVYIAPDEATVREHATKGMVIVSPDAGRVKVAERFAQHLSDMDADVAFINKRRPKGTTNFVEAKEVIGEVDGRCCIITDDMIDTGGTVVSAAELLLKRGAAEVWCMATHGVLSGPAVKRLRDSPFTRVVLTNTLPTPSQEDLPQLAVLSIAPIIAEALSAVFDDTSVSEIFDGENLA